MEWQKRDPAQRGCTWIFRNELECITTHYKLAYFGWSGLRGVTSLTGCVDCSIAPGL